MAREDDLARAWRLSAFPQFVSLVLTAFCTVDTLLPNATKGMQMHQQFQQAEIGWEAAWLSNEDRAFDDLADAANDEAEAEKSQPIYRTPASADGILDAAEAAAKAYQERTGCTLAEMYAFEAGRVRGLLRRELHRAAALERELIRELQLALNETCNSYHDAGHAQRVKATFGLVMEGGL